MTAEQPTATPTDATPTDPTPTDPTPTDPTPSDPTPSDAAPTDAAPPDATPALRALAEAAVAHTPRPYRHDPGSGLGFGLEVAQALGVAPERVFKTMVATVDHDVVVALVPVSARLDLKALARAVGGKTAALAERSVAERATGYVVGGISPFGQRTRLRTVVDTSLHDHERVIVSAGRRGLQVEVAPADLVSVTGALTAPLAQA